MDTTEYMKKMGFSEREIKKVIKKRENCKHGRTDKLIQYRKNYPHGRKSKPVFIFHKTWGKRCKNCFELFRPEDERFWQEDL